MLVCSSGFQGALCGDQDGPQNLNTYSLALSEIAGQLTLVLSLRTGGSQSEPEFADQQHTSVFIKKMQILKLYTRLIR